MPALAPTPVDPLPAGPSTENLATFDTDADAFIGALSPFTTQINAVSDVAYQNAVFAGQQGDLVASKVTEAAGSATTATTQAGIAQGFAQTAVNAPGTSATSTDTLTISVAGKSFTIQTGKALVVGMSVKIANTSSPTNWMFGDITAYNAGTGAITVSVTGVNGSGTASAWTLSLSGPGIVGNYAPKYDVLNDLGTVANNGTAAINVSTSEYCRIQAGGNITLTTSGWPTSGSLGEVFAECVNFGGKVITLPTIQWYMPDRTTTTVFATYAAAAGLTLQTTGTNWLLLWSRDAGATITGRFL